MNSSTTRSPSIQFPATWASVHFDLLRGLAAFFVLFEHWRNLFFVDYPHITAYRLPFAVFYALASAGHQSVIVFFVLSGYFIGGTVFRSVERNQWAWSSYLLRRLVRLWTVLIPPFSFASSGTGWEFIFVSRPPSTPVTSPTTWSGMYRRRLLLEFSSATCSSSRPFLPLCSAPTELSGAWPTSSGTTFSFRLASSPSGAPSDLPTGCFVRLSS
jgi:peptidoglycan/LPS O-acetylase OafA/YrhL